MKHAVKQALVDFATGKKNGAVVLKGEWGVGKTHLWGSVVEEHKNEFSNKYYSCVSLFGLSTLKGLKQAIYEGLVVKDKSELSGTAIALKDGVGGVLSFLRRNSKLLSGSKRLEPLIESYQSSAISDVLVCLDDFERKGKGLADGEILGLISFLVEKRGCKVVLILNENEHVSGGDGFAGYREKVFNYELEYKPSSRDCAELVFNEGRADEKELVERLVKLDVRNIRLIGKVRYYYDYILSKVDISSEGVLSDIRCVLPLAVLAGYAGAQAPAELEVLLKFDGWFGSPLPDSDPAEIERYQRLEQQAEALRSYGYLSTSSLDIAVINLVLKGYVDQADLDEVLVAANDKLKAHKAEQIYNAAWLSFHCDFSISQEDFVKKIDGAIESYFEYLTVDRLGSVVRLYRELGYNKKADDLIKKFFAFLAGSRTLADRRQLWDEPTDEIIKEELDIYFGGLGESMSLDEALGFLLSKRPTAEAVSVLIKSSEDDYYSYFTSPDTLDVKGVMKFLLESASAVNVFDDAVPGSSKKIFVSVYGALRRIRGLSALNEIRLAPLMGSQELYDEAVLDSHQL